MSKSTYLQQSLLAAYTRGGDDGIISKLSRVKEKGIRYYRHLVFNIVSDGVSNAYPIMTDFFGEEKMKELVHDFFSNQKCQNFQVWAMPKEFKDYLLQYKKDMMERYPFIPDLLLFEWMEIEMFMMPDEVMPDYEKEGNILKDNLVLNPEIQILFFHYPVHAKHPIKISEQDKGEYFVLMHRQPENKDIIFTNLNLAVVKIIEALYHEPLCIDEIQKLFSPTSLEQKEEIKQFIREALRSGSIIGFQKNK